MTVGIVRTVWSGTTGGQGLTQMAFGGDVGGGGVAWTNGDAQELVDAVRTFWNSQAAYLPNEVTLTVDPVVAIYESFNAALLPPVTAAAPPSPVVGGDIGVYSMASGFRYVWNTSAIFRRRRVRGSTYVVPAGQGAYDSGGTLSGGGITNWTNYANTLIGAATASGHPMYVWSRPTTIAASDGAIHPVIGVSIPDKVAILRGRRD